MSSESELAAMTVDLSDALNQYPDVSKRDKAQACLALSLVYAKLAGISREQIPEMMDEIELEAPEGLPS